MLPFVVRKWRMGMCNVSYRMAYLLPYLERVMLMPMMRDGCLRDVWHKIAVVSSKC